MTTIRFDTPPGMPLLRLALTARRRLTEGATIPPLRAELAPRRFDEVEAYARICGFTEADPLPLPFLQVIAAPLHSAILAHGEFPLPAMGLVHVANRIVQHRAIAGSEEVALAASVEGHRLVKQGAEFDLITTAEVEGERVWEAVTTVLSRAVQGEGASTREDPEPLRELQRSTTWRLPSDLGRRYGTIAGDRNPIHLYPLTARPFGFKRHIIHGMWTLARALAELDVPSGPGTLDVVFRRPVMLPATVRFESGATEGGLAFQVLRPRDDKVHLYGMLGAEVS